MVDISHGVEEEDIMDRQLTSERAGLEIRKYEVVHASIILS